LKGAVSHQLLAGEDVTEIVGVGRLRRHLGSGDAESGGICADGDRVKSLKSLGR
jgi:hypothetical protein